MKLKTMLLATTVALGLASPAFADSFGVRLGSPLSVQYSGGGGFADEKFRVGAGLFGFSGIGVYGDYFLDRLPLSKVNNYDLSLAYGAGASGFFGSYGVFGASVSYFSLGVHGIGMLELPFSSAISGFLDFNVGVAYDIVTTNVSGVSYGGLRPNFGGSIGVNFKL
jgi:hypothetical protein